MQSTRFTAGAALALAVLFTGCQRQQADTSAASASASASAPASAPAAGTAAPAGVAELQKTDTVQGTGAEAKAGAMVTVNYTGWLYEPDAPQHHGTQFDSSVGREPFTFRLGSGGVIAGWDQGVQGMKVGGKRTLVVPAALAYGSDGVGPIPPNSTLVFDIELLNVQ